MKILILGSFPPHENKRHYNFYYPNKANHFWKVLAHFDGYCLKHFSGDDAVKERQDLMTRMKIGVQNLGKQIERNGKSSLDTNIRILAYQDVFSILHKHREIRRILLPGFSAESSTTRSFLDYLQKKNIKHERPLKLGQGIQFNLLIGGRVIECVILYSTSPAFKRKYEDLLPYFEPYLKVR